MRKNHVKTNRSLAARAGLKKPGYQSEKNPFAQASSFSLGVERDLHQEMKEVKETIIAGGVDLTKPTALRRQVQNYVRFLDNMIKKVDQHEVERIAEERDSWNALLDKRPAGLGLKALLPDAA